MGIFSKWRGLPDEVGPPPAAPAQAADAPRPSRTRDDAPADVPTTALTAHEMMLMQSGQTIAAIKLYRDRTGAGLKESKDAVEARGAAGVERAAQADAGVGVAPAATSAQAEADAGVDDLIAQGRLIEAIKRHRELHGTGLKESKDAVEARRAALGLG